MSKSAKPSTNSNSKTTPSSKLSERVVLILDKMGKDNITIDDEWTFILDILTELNQAESATINERIKVDII